MNNEQTRLELHCHLAADNTDPLLRRIVLVRGSQPIRQATASGVQGAKTIKAFCIGLLRAKYRSMDSSLGTAWCQIARGAPRMTWAATLVENLGENKNPAWWTKYIEPDLRDPKDKNGFIPLPFRLTETQGKFNITFDPETKHSDGIWSIMRLRIFLDESEITGERLRNLALQWEQQEKTWELLPFPELTIPTLKLAANLELLVRSRSTGRFISVSDEPSLLPVTQGDVLQLRIQVDQRAHICLVWIDQCGEPLPMYPWDWKKARQKDAWQQPVTFEEQINVSVPDASDTSENILSVDNEAGFQTLILMVNLGDLSNSDVVKRLPGLLRAQEKQSAAPSLNKVVRSEFTRNQNIRRPALRVRGPAVIKDPLRVFHEKLGKNLVEHFDQIIMLSFPTMKLEP